MGLRAVILFVCFGLSQAKIVDLSCSQIRQFVDGHNSRRLQVAAGRLKDQPAASSMNSVIWDAELAAKAVKWASTGAGYHNPDKTVPSGRFGTGENIYWMSTTNKAQKINPEEAIKGWFSEHKDYTYGPIKIEDFDSSRPAIGHYTQMIWSETTHVGCGVARTVKNEWNKFMVVCNYGPAGNYIGETPYNSGSASDGLSCGIGDCSRQYGDRC